MTAPRWHVQSPVIAGNWKLNKGPRETREFFRSFCADYGPHSDRTVIFFPPSISLHSAAEAVAHRQDLLLGVQNVYWKAAGAFTGEISAPMAAQTGARFALAGHSERRHIFGESDEDVGRKAAAAMAAGLTPMICVGEALAERRAGRLEEVLTRQLLAALTSEDQPMEPRFLLAYEPVWAIGTGVNATPEDASAAHHFLRRLLVQQFGQARAAVIPILYGGSVKPDNAGELLAAPAVEGLLVGGASLDPAGFARIAAIQPTIKR